MTAAEDMSVLEELEEAEEGYDEPEEVRGWVFKVIITVCRGLSGGVLGGGCAWWWVVLGELEKAKEGYDEPEEVRGQRARGRGGGWGWGGGRGGGMGRWVERQKRALMEPDEVGVLTREVNVGRG
jgi:hypothetical protein